MCEDMGNKIELLLVSIYAYPTILRVDFEHPVCGTIRYAVCKSFGLWVNQQCMDGLASMLQSLHSRTSTNVDVDTKYIQQGLIALKRYQHTVECVWILAVCVVNNDLVRMTTSIWLFRLENLGGIHGVISVLADCYTFQINIRKWLLFRQS